jgi:hypothetical protein
MRNQNQPGKVRRVGAALLIPLAGATVLGACGGTNMQQTIGQVNRGKDMAKRSGILLEEEPVGVEGSKMLDGVTTRMNSEDNRVAEDGGYQDSRTGLTIEKLTQDGDIITYKISMTGDPKCSSEFILNPNPKDHATNGGWNFAPTDREKLAKNPKETINAPGELLGSGISEEAWRKQIGIS